MSKLLFSAIAGSIWMKKTTINEKRYNTYLFVVIMPKGARSKLNKENVKIKKLK